MKIILVAVLLVIEPLICVVNAAEAESSSFSPEEEGEHPVNHTEHPYCFKLTWIGPKYDGESKIQNLTCDDLMFGTKGLPCRRPLVATNNSNIPDMNWIWEHYKKNPTEVACRLSRGDVCIKYSFIYNGAVENITYMCSKVYIDGEKPTTSGCYSQFQNGREIEVCACESSAGKVPCNGASLVELNYLMWVLFSFFSILVCRCRKY